MENKADMAGQRGPSGCKVADWPRLAGAWGSLRRALAQREASGEPAGRVLSHLVFHIGVGHELLERVPHRRRDVVALQRVRVRLRLRLRLRLRVTSPA